MQILLSWLSFNFFLINVKWLKDFKEQYKCNILWKRTLTMWFCFLSWYKMFYSHWSILWARSSHSPLHQCKYPRRSAVGSPRSLCRCSPSPRRPEGPRALPAGASERTARKPPANRSEGEGRQRRWHHRLFHCRRGGMWLSALPLCTKIIQAAARPWSRPRWSPTGCLLWSPCFLPSRDKMNQC